MITARSYAYAAHMARLLAQSAIFWAEQVSAELGRGNPDGALFALYLAAVDRDLASQWRAAARRIGDRRPTS